MGGSILLLEGVYLVTRKLRLDRSVHIFGRGRAELRGKEPDRVIESTSLSATLDRLLIDNVAKGDSWTLYVPFGHLRLQGCDVSSHVDNGCSALLASGHSTVADMLGCTFRGGGGDGVNFFHGASGRAEGCDFPIFRSGSGIAVESVGTSPLVSRNAFRDCKVGVHVWLNVDPSWSLGEGNVFSYCAEGDVVDERVPPGPPVPAPAPPALE